MDAADLKNYGRSLLEMLGSLPAESGESVADAAATIMAEHLTADDLARYAAELSAEKERMLERDLEPVGIYGLDSEEFTAQQVQWAASFSALAKVGGSERAAEILGEIAEQTWPALLFAVFPPPDSFRLCGDPFQTFSQWFVAMMDANREAGALVSEVVEKGPDVLQVNCTWCAWHEAYRRRGVPDACPPVCHVDDVFFPDYCGRIGIEYKRTSTLSRAGDYCDYRFKRAISSVPECPQTAERGGDNRVPDV